MSLFLFLFYGIVNKMKPFPFIAAVKDSKVFLDALAFNLVIKSLHFDHKFKTVLRNISVKV